MRKRIATIKDVAATANVSTATVSNVLHGKDALYTPATAHAVWTAVRELGYRPNRIARSLVRRRTETLGVVVEKPHGRLTSNTYMIALLDGFLEYAVNAGFQVKLFSMFMKDPHVALAQLDDGSVDGLALFAPPEDSPVLAWARTSHPPIVVAGSVPPDSQLPSIALDDREAAYQAVRWLIAQGHRQIGLLTGPREQWSALRREEGYRQALQEAGLDYRPEWRCVGGYTAESAEAGAAELISAPLPPTAILCWNDWIALGALKTLRKHGLRVPEDISLLSFDDIEPGHWVTPPLTTVQQPTHAMGSKAAEILIRQIQTGKREEGVFLFTGTLVVRQSVAPPKGGTQTRL